MPLLRSSIRFCPCLPRVAFRALPSFHPGLCRSVALAGLFVGLSAFTQGFISGFALISPWAMQEYRPFRAHCRIGRLGCCVVVLCSLNVFGCVNGLLCLVVYLFDFDCIVCGIGGIDWCGRAMSPNGAILLQSPGHKPWVNHRNTFIEPCKGGTFLTNAKPQTANNDTEQQAQTPPPNKSNN